MRRVVQFALTAMVALLPSVVFAQGTIAGVVRDASGAVLPGVTVEAASPVLIEKVRSVTTDGTGQYRIVDLRPGVYTVTFSLTGFSTVKNETVEVSGSAIVPVNADMRVGSLEESITVTGEAALVDVQSTTKQAVLNREVVDAIPSGRDQFQVAMLIPGMAIGSRAQDVGGTSAGGNANLMIHGARADQQRMTQNGLSTATLAAMGSTAGSVPNIVATQEVTIDVSAASAELSTGGVRLNVIPREGGNTFRGSMFATFGNRSMQNDNYDDKLLNRGLLLHSGHLVKTTFDLNPGFGGPIKRDRVWFFMTVRYNVADNYAAGNTYFNRNINAFKWEPDTTKGTPNLKTYAKNITGRLTAQLTARNKVAVTYDQQDRCNCLGGSTGTSPEAATASTYPLQRIIQGDWTVPLTSRLLMEVVALNRIEGFGNKVAYPELQATPFNVSFTDSNGPNGNIVYRGPQPIGARARSTNSNWRASISYITGSHNFKVGYNDLNGYTNGRRLVQPWPLSRYSVSGSSAVTATNPLGLFVPNQVSLSAVSMDDVSRTNLDHDLGIFAQDKWTYKRMTLSLGIRYDYFATSFGEQTLGNSDLAPNRARTFPEGKGNHLGDLTPKSGVVFDLFGNGRTALRFSANKYVEGLGAGGVGNTSPGAGAVGATNRNWTDNGANGGIAGDFVVQCDLANPLANGECGANTTANFGGVSPSLNTTNPDVRGGFNHRGYNWEFAAGVTHQLVPRVSVDFGYYRRIYGNLYVTDNLSNTAANFDRYSVRVPTTTTKDGQSLPGAGSTIDGYYALNPNSTCNGPTGAQPCVLNGTVVAAQNYLTFAKDYGRYSDHWNGFDVNVTARLPQLTLQGGTSTGSASIDMCEVAAKLPEMLSGFNYFGPNGPSSGGGNTAPGAITGTGLTPTGYCKMSQPWQTQLKGLAVYTIPRIDLQVSGTWQFTPGTPIIANINARSDDTSLGRFYAGGNANTTVSTNVIEPGTMYGDALTQLDLRFAKILRVGGARAQLSLDLYNALNSNPVLSENRTFSVTTASAPFSAWRTPNTVLTARLFKVSANIDF